ncbi:hypothetical protein WMY93_032582 [Mugilogobius chulae]|uniref:PX domain-containing protein n=1 Tax=Mugilogobius chulae TaxID=88201 RepID=A0AAW0MJ53_9GOBI
MHRDQGAYRTESIVSYLIPRSSSLTTKELQQNLREEKSRERPHSLLFELPSHRVKETAFSKHVVFEVVIMRSGSFDSHRVSIERRYSDFDKLHQSLLQEFDEELEEITLPRKLLTGNFNPSACWSDG